MSRSYRKYKGLSHNMSSTKRGRGWNKTLRRIDRARSKAMPDDDATFRPCHKSNCYDGKITDEDFEYIAGRRSKGYSPNRTKHKFWGK